MRSTRNGAREVCKIELSSHDEERERRERSQKAGKSAEEHERKDQMVISLIIIK
jgi:hypothetical protein